MHSDRVFKNLSQTKRPVRIVPFRGEYMSFKDEYKNMVNHLVYPVPNPKFPFFSNMIVPLQIPVNSFICDDTPNAITVLK